MPELKKDFGYDEAIGRNKGGLSTKIPTCDALGNPTGFHLTAGQRHELVGADVLMTKLALSKAVIANKAYDADKSMRHKLQAAGCIIVIPSSISL